MDWRVSHVSIEISSADKTYIEEIGKDWERRGGGTMVERSLELTLRKGWVFFLRILGVALVIIGLITAALNITLAGFTPILWILLALASFLGVICNSLFRIVINLEKKTRGFGDTSPSLDGDAL